MPDMDSWLDAFTSRRDIAQERIPGRPMEASNGQLDGISELVGALRNLEHEPSITSELVIVNPGQALTETRVDAAPGFRRTVVVRTSTPPSNLSIPVTGAIIFVGNHARLGGAIVNTGANALLLVLGIDLQNLTGAPMGGAAQAGYGTLWLAPNGGSWNFKLTDIIWGGSVYGYALGGTTTIVGVEL